MNSGGVAEVVISGLGESPSDDVVQSDVENSVNSGDSRVSGVTSLRASVAGVAGLRSACSGVAEVATFESSDDENSCVCSEDESSAVESSSEESSGDISSCESTYDVAVDNGRLAR